MTAFAELLAKQTAFVELTQSAEIVGQGNSQAIGAFNLMLDIVTP